MGQKTHPIGFRLGVTKTWNSRWYEERSYAKWLHQDLKIRKYIKEELKDASIAKVPIERMSNRIKVEIHTARPGVVIGKKGQKLEQLREKLSRLTNSEVVVNIIEVRKPELNAQLVAETIAAQIERRASFRKVMKKAIQTAMKRGALGIKVRCAGRLGGAEMARKTWDREGKVPLHTLRADIDYGFAIAKTTYGVIGVKCWINLEKKKKK